jgi:hypothetical protein
LVDKNTFVSQDYRLKKIQITQFYCPH